MKRSFFTLLAASAMTFAIVGCDEAQYENAVENYGEEVNETQDTLMEAKRDGVLDNDEIDALQEERQETRSAAGEVSEQAGDLIEAKTD